MLHQPRHAEGCSRPRWPPTEHSTRWGQWRLPFLLRDQAEAIVPTDARTLRLLRDEGWEEGSRARWPDSGSAPAGGCAQLEASSLLVRSRPGLASSPAPSGKHGPEVLATQLSLDSRMDPALVRRSWRLSRARSRSICLQKGCYRDRAHS